MEPSGRSIRPRPCKQSLFPLIMRSSDLNDLPVAVRIVAISLFLSRFYGASVGLRIFAPVLHMEEGFFPGCCRFLSYNRKLHLGTE